MGSRTELTALLISLLSSAALVLSVPAAAANFLIYDDFDDNEIDHSLWTAYKSDPGPIVSESNQTLEIVYPAESDGEVFGAGYDGLCELSGDFDIQVDYRPPVWPPANGVRVALVTTFGSVERTSFGKSPDFPDQPREVYLTNFGDVVSGITGTTHLSGKLRQVRSGNTVSGYYLSDGSWVLIHTAQATTNNAAFSLSSWSHDYAFSDEAVQATFDNMIVNEGILVCPPIEVSIDVKPGDQPNSLQPNSNGRIPVAILTTDSFAANSVDPSTVLFGPTGTEASSAQSALEDVDGDGDTDLILHFRTQDAAIHCGDTTLLLVGTTSTGRVVVGSDYVTTVGCK